MLKSSILEILRTFSKQELAKFEDFVRSPYFNKKNNVVRLFLELKKFAPEFNDETLKKEKVWVNLFPGKEYNYGILKNLIFDLNQLADQFIMDLKFREDDYTKNEYLLNGYLERELKNIFSNKYNSLIKQYGSTMNNSDDQSVNDYFRFLSKLYDRKLKYQHTFDRRQLSSDDPMINRDSCQIANLLILMFGSYNDILVMSGEKNADVIDHPVILLLDAVTPVMERLLDSIENNSEINSLYLRIHYKMYLAMKERTEQSYMEFRNLFFDNMDTFTNNDKHDMHYCLITAVYLTKNRKEIHRYREIINVLDSMADNNVITEKGNDRIPYHVFYLYITTAFTLLDSGKIKSFSDRFLKHLDPVKEMNMRIYVNFMTEFLSGNFTEALRQLSLLELDYTGMKIGVRYHKAMCMYETDDYEMFLNESDNLKHFMKNNDFLTDEHKRLLTSHYNFIDKLFLFRRSFDHYEFLNLKNEVMAKFKSTSLWFERKFDEIEQESRSKSKAGSEKDKLE